MKRLTAFTLLLLTCLSAYADVECLSGDDARKAFLAEGKEPYFSLLQPREMAAKTGHAVMKMDLQKQQDTIRAEYRKAVLNCTPDETKALNSYVSIIDSNVKKLYPGLVSLPWHFVKVQDTVEGGLPHTREDVIVLSQSMLDAIEQSAHNGQWKLGIMNVLIHEQIHVIQRVRRAAFEKLYEDAWGFRKASEIKGASAWLAAHQIVNPDGVDVQWVWPVPATSRIIWPRIILEGENEKPVMPDDFKMIGIELTATKDGYTVVTDKKGAPKYHTLQEETGYMQKFGHVSSIYHPNEIAADYLANLAVLDCLIDKNHLPKEQLAKVDEIYKPIRSWAQATFGKPAK